MLELLQGGRLRVRLSACALPSATSRGTHDRLLRNPLRLHVEPRGLGRVDHAGCDGGRARHRQPDLHLDPDQQAAGGTPAEGATARDRRRADHAAAAAGYHLLDRRPDPAGLHRFRPRLFLARPDPDRRRPFPDLEGDQGNPPHRRSRRPQGRHGRSHGQRHARRRDLPDPAARPGLLGRTRSSPPSA